MLRNSLAQSRSQFATQPKLAKLIWLVAVVGRFRLIFTLEAQAKASEIVSCQKLLSIFYPSEINGLKLLWRHSSLLQLHNNNNRENERMRESFRVFYKIRLETIYTGAGVCLVNACKRAREEPTSCLKHRSYRWHWQWQPFRSHARN